VSLVTFVVTTNKTRRVIPLQQQGFLSSYSIKESMSYSDLFVESRRFILLHLTYIWRPHWVTPFEFR